MLVLENFKNGFFVVVDLINFVVEFCEVWISVVNKVLLFYIEIEVICFSLFEYWECVEKR